MLFIYFVFFLSSVPHSLIGEFKFISSLCDPPLFPESFLCGCFPLVFACESVICLAASCLNLIVLCVLCSVSSLNSLSHYP